VAHPGGLLRCAACSPVCHDSLNPCQCDRPQELVHSRYRVRLVSSQCVRHPAVVGGAYNTSASIHPFAASRAVASNRSSRSRSRAPGAASLWGCYASRQRRYPSMRRDR
jgi:hypothetical protein